MTKARTIILTTVATICMIGLTAGASYSGSGSHGKHSGKTSSKQPTERSQTEAGSATGTGAAGITESLSTSEAGASAPLPEGMGARQFVRSQYTVEKVGPEGTGAAAGGSTGTTSDKTMQRGTGETTRDSEMERSTGGTVEQESGQTIDQGTGGADDQGTGWMRDRGPGGTVGESGETGGTMNRNSGDTNIGSEGRSEPRSGDTTGSGSSANPEAPQ